MRKRIHVLIFVAVIAFCGAHGQRWNTQLPQRIEVNANSQNLKPQKEAKSASLESRKRELRLAGKHPNIAGDITVAAIMVNVGEPCAKLESSYGSRIQVLVAANDFVDANDPVSMDNSWNLFKNGGQPLVDFYDGLYGKIPVNAGPTLDYSQGIAWETLALQVAPGTYDIVFTDIDSLYYYNEDYQFHNPAPTLVKDNFEMEAGWLYYFEWYYSPGQLDNEIAIPPYEVEATGLTSTPSSAELTANEPITITFVNNGIQSLTDFDMYYSVNGGAEVHETLILTAQDAVTAGSSYSYTFNAKADFSAVGEYQVTARVESAGDYDPDNNTVAITVKHTVAGTLPFFDPIDETLSNWVIIDKNGSDDIMGTWSAWAVYDADWNVNGYYALYYYISDRPGDDYMRTVRPYYLEAGDYHISFKQFRMHEDYPETLKVWYGASPDVNSMSLLETIPVENVNEAKKIVNLNNTTAGNYYFAIQAVSDADRFGIGIDDIEIGAGHQTPQPDMYAYSLQFKAYQSCELAHDSAAFVFSNMGDVGSLASVIDIKHKLDDGAWQTQTLSFPNLEGIDGLKTGEGMIVFFKDLDLSAFGEHTLTAVAETPNQGTLYNDTIVSKITKTEPVSHLPYIYNFGNAADIVEWTMLTPLSWRYEEEHIAAWELNEPLISKCFELTAGDYEINTTFTAGLFFSSDFTIPSDFIITMGQPGLFPEEWTDTIVYERERNTLGQDISVVYPCKVMENGIYQFAYTLLSGDLSIRSFELSKVPASVEQINNKVLLTLAPNPATTQATVSAKNDGIMQVTVSDLTGKRLFVSPENLNTAIYNIDISQMPKGVYLVKIITGNASNTQTKKLIVK
ncbi:MAG: T9SS type A sorting domain-containing protein [Prevotellaceae bacterium]|jgi:hypothetical protein|nr:T9SS type A sorting domain-containing protein [Prevotellaceae bacterium]